MTKLFSYVFALTALVVGAGCESPGRDSAAKTAPMYEPGFVLQANEGEVLQMASPTRGRVLIKIDPAKTGSPHMAMGIQELEGEIPLHKHEHEEEFLFVHSGEGIGTLGDKSVRLSSGSTVYVPPGTWHGVKNIGDKPAEILWVVTPGTGDETNLEKFFRAISGPGGAYPKPLTPDQMGALMEQYGMSAKPQ